MTWTWTLNSSLLFLEQKRKKKKQTRPKNHPNHRNLNEKYNYANCFTLSGGVGSLSHIFKSSFFLAFCWALCIIAEPEAAYYYARKAIVQPLSFVLVMFRTEFLVNYVFRFCLLRPPVMLIILMIDSSFFCHKYALIIFAVFFFVFFLDTTANPRSIQSMLTFYVESDNKSTLYG